MPGATTRARDPTELLANEEDPAACVDAAPRDGAPARVAAALGGTARATGMAQVAVASGATSLLMPLAYRREPVDWSVHMSTGIDVRFYPGAREALFGSNAR